MIDSVKLPKPKVRSEWDILWCHENLSLKLHLKGGLNEVFECLTSGEDRWSSADIRAQHVVSLDWLQSTTMFVEMCSER
jgi:hypothetical protein